MKKHKKAYLILEDGTVMQGKSFGAEKSSMGEVVFNTGMTGYQEVLSDPSYCGQIVTMTYPLIGNYGINRDDFESIAPFIHGFIVKEHSDYPNNWRKETTLDELLRERDIPGICDIDTRKLTRIIREQGTMRGMIVSEEDFDEAALVTQIKEMKLMVDQVAQVSTKSSFHCPGSKQRVVMVDFGSKAGILRELTNRNCDIRVVPHNTSAEEIIRLRPDGVLLSNGPGDPKDVPEAIKMIKGIMGKFPIFGICLGHQLLALACGADTEKMKFGHRGANHPVRDLEHDITMMTSQNHGFTVSKESLTGTRLQVTQIAVNDESIEGLKHVDFPAFSVQFHPEASPGPFDSNHLFDHYIELIEAHIKKGEKTHAAL